MNKTELSRIGDLLEGYEPFNRWEIIKANKNDNGDWELTIRKIEEAKPNESDK